MEITLELVLQLFVLFMIFNYAMWLINGLLKLIMEHLIGNNKNKNKNQDNKNFKKDFDAFKNSMKEVIHSNICVNLQTIKDIVNNLNKQSKKNQNILNEYEHQFKILTNKIDYLIKQNESKENHIIIDNNFVEKLANTPITCKLANETIESE